MNLFELFATITLDDSEYTDKLDKAAKNTTSFGEKLKAGFATAAKVGAGFATAIGGAVTALNGVAESTEESRIATGKLNTAFEAAGMSTKAAATAYNEFYKILGDTDTATEASQLLAQLAESEQDLTKWTQIAAGVNGTFGDSLPIESLIESANETAKVGQITGTLADALNWVGISEDEFNEKLAAASSEAERNQMIMETLSAQYETASESFYKNNEAIIAQRESQNELSNAMSNIGEAVQNVKTALMGDFMPSIVTMSNGLAALVSGDDSAIGKLSTGLQDFIARLQEKVPQVIAVGTSIVKTLASAIIQNLPELVNGAISLVSELGGFIIAELPTLLSTAIEIVKSIAKGISENIGELTDSVVNIILEMVDILTDPETLSSLIQSAFTILGELATGLINAIPKITDKIPEIVDNLVDTFLNPENLETYLQTGIDIITALFSNVPRILESVGNSIGKIIDGLVEDFTNFDWSGVGERIVGKITDGFNAIKGAGEDLADLIGLDGSFGMNSSSGTTYSGTSIDGSHFNGLDYVPYDGYIAELHKGEKVLTAAEARTHKDEPTIVQYNYFTAPYDSNEQEKANEKALNAIAFSH